MNFVASWPFVDLARQPGFASVVPGRPDRMNRDDEMRRTVGRRIQEKGVEASGAFENLVEQSGLQAPAAAKRGMAEHTHHVVAIVPRGPMLALKMMRDSGRQMRAVDENERGAHILGANFKRIESADFGVLVGPPRR